MNKSVSIFVSGLVAIGIATAVLLPGRPTAAVIKSVGDAGSGLLGTAISGK